MALADLLASLINPQAAGNPLGFGQSANAIAPGQSTAPGAQGVMPVSELLVGERKAQANPTPVPTVAASNPSAQLTSQQNSPQMAPAPSADLNPSTTPPIGVGQGPQPNGLNYNNSTQVAGVHSALGGEQAASGNPTSGIYGLLPQSLQHGTLRSILGSLGDAFLVGSNRAPQYQPRMDREAIGNAMAGIDYDDPKSVEAAIERVGATGAAGSTEAAGQLRQQENELRIRQMMQEQALWWHQQQSHDREQNSLNRVQGLISGGVMGASTPEQFKNVYQQAEAMAQRVGPDYHASDLGLVIPPDQWQPGVYSNFGMSGNQVTESTDRGAQRDNTLEIAKISAGSRLGAAGEEAAAHVTVGKLEADKPTGGTIMQGVVDRLRNGTADDYDRQYFAAHNQTRRGGSSLAPGMTVGGQPAPTARTAPAPHYTHVATAPGKPRMGWNGTAWVAF